MSNYDVEYETDGVTVAGGNGWGNELNQLARPLCICVDDDQTVYVSDHYNQRIIEWKRDSTQGRVIAGGNGQLNGPLKVILEPKTNSLLICDYYNKRVVRFPQEEIIIPNVSCSSMMMGPDGYLYVADFAKQQVIRWNLAENVGTVVVSGEDVGYPLYIFVDQDCSIYTSDRSKHRVMKWIPGAQEGIVVASEGLCNPHGIVVDPLGTIYIADAGHHRVVRWPKGATEGTGIIDADHPCDLAFDREKNLYVLDYNQQRVQKFFVR